MDEKDGMTDAQKKVIDECYEKLSEHFDAFVLLTMLNPDDDSSQIHATHNGGFYNALGLIDQGHHYYLNRMFTKEE